MVAVVVHNEKGKEKILLLSFLLIEDYDRISRNLHGEASFAYKYILRFGKSCCISFYILYVYTYKKFT